MFPTDFNRKQTALMHHPNVTTKHDKQSRITAGGNWKRSSKFCLCFFSAVSIPSSNEKYFKISPEKYFSSAIDHESKC